MPEILDYFRKNVLFCRNSKRDLENRTPLRRRWQYPNDQ
ncbi:hypothetical protein ACHAXS_012369 [Conticribra weissflogii]